MEKMKKNVKNEEKVRVAARAAVESCTVFFGPGCDLDVDNLAETIIHKEKHIHPDYLNNWDRLISNIDKASLSLRQCIIMHIAGAVHDYEVGHRSDDPTPISTSEYSWCTYWWLLGESDIITVAKEPEVEDVLTGLHLVKRRKCPHGFMMSTRADDSIYRDGFYETFIKYSRRHQRHYGVSKEGLGQFITMGKKFYPSLPDIVARDIEEDPLVVHNMCRSILNRHGNVWSEKDKELRINISPEESKRILRSSCSGFFDDNGNKVQATVNI